MIQYRNVDNWKLINYQGHDIKGVYSSIGKVWPQETPPTPTFEGKWLATYTGGTVSSAECDATSAITRNEINLAKLVAVEIGECVTSIGTNAFREGYLSAVTFPNTLETIGDSAFKGCHRLSSLTIPNSVTSIGREAFNQCTRLPNITISSNVATIGNRAFQDCSGLTSCTIGSAITSIGESAFYNCNYLTKLTIEATTPPALGGYTFELTNNCPIYVPAQSVSAYQSAWSSYSSRIQAIQ